MIHALGSHLHSTNLVDSFRQIPISDSRRELVQFHRKIVVFHLARQHVMER